jgi:predicted membrane chloride channel (bestrophin family)
MTLNLSEPLTPQIRSNLVQAANESRRRIFWMGRYTQNNIDREIEAYRILALLEIADSIRALQEGENDA